MGNNYCKELKELFNAALSDYERGLKDANKFLRETGPRVVEKPARPRTSMFDGGSPEVSRPREATVIGALEMQNRAHEKFLVALREIESKVKSNVNKIPTGQIFPDKHDSY